jgi:[ribosomal protein S18]-alanine N-acetyltransferase
VSGVRLRAAGAADLATIVAIDRACFPHPWPRESWQAELGRSFCAITLAQTERGDIVGLSCAWILPPDETHLLRLATLAEHRGLGVGRDLLCAVVAAARFAGCAAVVLEVGKGNVAARRLYEREGFATIGVRPRYYSDPLDDAIVMRRTLGGATRG